MEKTNCTDLREIAGFRLERDSLGDVFVPENAYFGPETQRAITNFPISGIRLSREMIWALGLVKYSAAKVNHELDILSPELAQAIMDAAKEVSEGKFDSEFPIDIFQTGSGTSSNMNANEVIARRANEILHSEILHSNVSVLAHEHVNLCQSSNDVFPSAINIALAKIISCDLIPALRALSDSLSKKSSEFSSCIKAGRTHLQDAAPITLGQEFSGYNAQIINSMKLMQNALQEVLKLPLGGTAVGTGLNAHPLFAERAISAISKQTNLEFREVENHFYPQAFLEAALNMSSQFRLLAASLTKIANDIRWLASGPSCGLGEIILPEVAPGSSIMPGKINPVIVESLLMVCAQVIGNDQAVIIGVYTGSIFELNTMMPLIAHNILQSAKILSSSVSSFSTKCIDGLSANSERLSNNACSTSALVTALVPLVGYDKAAVIAKNALHTSRSIIEVAREMTGVSEEVLEKVLSPWNMLSRKKS